MVKCSLRSLVRSFSELYSAPSNSPTPSTDEQNVPDSGEMWREHLHSLIKLYTFGRKYPHWDFKYTHSGLNIQGCKFSDFCLTSEKFSSKYLKMFFEISSL